MPHTLQTERLTLREFAESDIPELLPLIGAREVAEMTLTIPHPYEEKHAREYLSIAPKENELKMAIRRRGDGHLIGGIGLHPQTEHNRAEMGYWTGVPFWETDTLPRRLAESCATDLRLLSSIAFLPGTSMATRLLEQSF